MGTMTRDELNKSSVGLKGEDIQIWVENALDYIQDDGSEDFDMISKIVFYALFLEDPELVDDILLAQGKKYEKYLAKACAPNVKQVALNDAIAFGRLSSLRKPLRLDDELKGVNLLFNLCSKTPSVDVIIESIKILRGTFGAELTRGNISFLVDTLQGFTALQQKHSTKIDAEHSKNMQTNIAFGVFYAWSISERTELLALLSDLD